MLEFGGAFYLTIAVFLGVTLAGGYLLGRMIFGTSIYATLGGQMIVGAFMILIFPGLYNIFLI